MADSSRDDGRGNRHAPTVARALAAPCRVSRQEGEEMAKAEVHESATDDEVVLDLDLDPHWEKVYELEETATALRAALIRLGGTDPGRPSEGREDPARIGRLLGELVQAQDRASDVLNDLSELTRALAPQLRRAGALPPPRPLPASIKASS